MTQKKQSVNYENGKIYMIVNSINDKIYIGSTSTELRYRLRRHKNVAKLTDRKRNPNFYNDFRDNLECFKIILIENYPCQSKKELEKREYEIIQQKIKELGREKLYNLCLSQNGKGHHMFGKTGNETNFFGKNHTIESKIKISKANKGENHPRFGIKGKENPLFGITGKEHWNFKYGCISKIIDGRYTFQWTTYENENTKRKHTKSFSINKYGETEAYKLCLKFQKTIYPELNN